MWCVLISDGAVSPFGSATFPVEGVREGRLIPWLASAVVSDESSDLVERWIPAVSAVHFEPQRGKFQSIDPDVLGP